MRPQLCLVCLAFLAVTATAATATANPLREAIAGIEISDCGFALSILDRVQPQAHERHEHMHAAAKARACFGTEPKLDEAIALLRSYQTSVTDAAQRKDVDTWLAELEQLRPQLRREGARIAKDQGWMDKAQAHYEAKRCDQMLSDGLKNVSATGAAVFLRYRLLEARHNRCVGTYETLKRAVEILENLARASDDNRIVVHELDRTREEMYDKTPLSPEEQRRQAQFGTNIETYGALGFLTEKRDCAGAAAKFKAARPLGDEDGEYLYWSAHIDLCWGTTKHVAAAQAKLEQLVRMEDDVRVLILRSEIAKARQQAFQRDAEVQEVEARATKNKPELWPSGISLGVSGDYVMYRGLVEDNAGWAINGAAELDTLEIALGVLTGPSVAFNGRMDLRVVAWPRPSASKFSLIGLAGLSVRNEIEQEVIENDVALRLDLRAKARLTCGVLVTASYEKALNAGALDTVSIGLELQVKYFNDGLSVCRK